MMLRASIEAIGAEVDVRAITDPEVDSLVEGGDLLIGMVDATLSGDLSVRSRVASGVQAMLGPEALVDAAGVIATFSMMNRIADATGMPVGKGALQRTEDFRASAGIDRFHRE